VIGGLREHLGTPEAIAYFVECYNAERRESVRWPHDRRSLERELAAIDRQIERGVRAIIEGRITEGEAAGHLPTLRTQRADLAAKLAEAVSRPTPINARAAAMTAYFAELDLLEREGAADGEAGRMIREMIETVTVSAAAAPAPPMLTVSGGLGPILQETPRAGEWTGAG
jgi:transposase